MISSLCLRHIGAGWETVCPCLSVQRSALSEEMAAVQPANASLQQQLDDQTVQQQQQNKTGRSELGQTVAEYMDSIGSQTTAQTGQLNQDEQLMQTACVLSEQVRCLNLKLCQIEKATHFAEQRSDQAMLCLDDISRHTCQFS